jgi:hypothetical protein
LPLYVDRLGPSIFLWSTAIAVAVFAAFICLLGFAERKRLEETLWRIVAGAATVVVAVVLLYFTGLVPPIPLTVKDSGIYQNVVHTADGYQVTYEGSSRWSRFFSRTIHHVPGTPLYAYSAVFAPSAFSANVVHHWEHYDTTQKKWVTESMVAFTLSGGRENGYRGYSEKDNPEAGDWRVTIETTEGQVIGRLLFKIVNVQASPALYSDVK